MSAATTPAYCGACGTRLSAGAKFCRSCGSAQPLAAGLHPAPVAFGADRTAVPGNLLAPWLAMIGGAAMCFISLYAVFYLPLHNDYPVNYGQSVRFLDILAFGSGLAAIVIGALLLKRPGGRTGWGIWLTLAGAPTLVVALIWAFADPLNLSIFPLPFYFAYVYFTDIGVAHMGPVYLPVPLVLGCAMVVSAGVLLTAPTVSRPAPPVS